MVGMSRYFSKQIASLSQTISVLNFPTSKEKSIVLPAVTHGVEFVIIDLGTDLCINYTFYIECMRAMPV